MSLLEILLGPGLWTLKEYKKKLSNQSLQQGRFITTSKMYERRKNSSKKAKKLRRKYL